MARFIQKTLRCGCCGESFSADTLSAVHIGNTRGLDTNPHEPAVYERVLVCPSCGYASERIEKEVPEDIRGLVRSEEYQAMVRDDSTPQPMKKLFLASGLTEAQGELKKSAYLMLKAFWASEEAGTPVREYLDEAMFLYEKYLQDHADEDAAIIYTDLLRRSGAFSRAGELAGQLRDYVQDSYKKAILQYELTLIQGGDSAAHLLSEVPQ